MKKTRFFEQKDVSNLGLGNYYRAFHGFGQAKFSYGGLILGLSQFTLMGHHLSYKTMLDLKVVKIDSKIIF